MAGLNTAQIIDRARALGQNISSAQADQILKQAWDQGQYGADAGAVDSLLGGGGGGGSSSSGGGGNTSGGLPAFNFDWDQAEKDAMEKLKPYYDQLLKDAGGDVELAKKRLSEDYDNGMRTGQQDYNRTTQYAQQDYTTQTGDLSNQNAIDTRNTRGELNARGVYTSQIAGDQQGVSSAPSQYAQDYYINPQQQQYDSRKLALDRALQRQNEVAGTNWANQQQQYQQTKQRGIEDQDIAYNKYKKQMDQEERNKAMTQMAPISYNEAYQKYKYLNNIPG